MNRGHRGARHAERRGRPARSAPAGRPAVRPAPSPRTGSTRLKLTIEYAGTRYSGWQIQTNARTVQGELAAAIAEVAGTSVFELYGAGRTDAGVHALAQVAHLAIAVSMPTDTWRRRLNDLLPADIVVLSVEAVPHRFHARHDAVARAYLYQVARRRTAFAKPYVWWVKDDLDIPRMREVATALAGFHDFHAFTDDDPTEKSTTVHLEQLELVEDGDLILVHIVGSHFLWKMVRRIVGVLVAVGRGQLSSAEAKALVFDGASGDAVARITAPASGLFLAGVYYPGDTRRPPAPVTALPRR